MRTAIELAQEARRGYRLGKAGTQFLGMRWEDHWDRATR